MAALNGARLQKVHSSAVPVSIDEIADDAKKCFYAGAAAVHVHVRDKNGAHVLDAGLYRELLSEIKKRAPELIVQITTESAGKYSPAAQRKIVREVSPAAVSVALAEMFADGDEQKSFCFYLEAAERNIRVQHILRTPQEVAVLAGYVKSGGLPAAALSLLFVLGCYAGREARPADLRPFVAALKKSGLSARFMACAFGRRETTCLLTAAAAGGDCRIGLENNIYMDDGTPAPNNAARVAEFKKRLGA